MELINILWNEKVKDLDRKNELKDFFQKMANRLIVGFFRYGPAKKHQLYYQRLGEEYKAYKRTGNKEHLINIANYAFLESIMPSHPKYNHDPTVKSVTRKKFGV